MPHPAYNNQPQQRHSMINGHRRSNQQFVHNANNPYTHSPQQRAQQTQPQSFRRMLSHSTQQPQPQQFRQSNPSYPTHSAQPQSNHNVNNMNNINNRGMPR